jgi:hypothetical protein
MPLSREVGILSENEISKSERSAKEHYMKELSEEKLKVIRAFSSKFLVFFLYSCRLQRMLLDYYRYVCYFYVLPQIYIVHTTYVFLILAFLFNKISLPGETLGTLFNLLSFRIACFFLFGVKLVRKERLLGRVSN